jgi:hypothetical protein
MLFFKHIEYLEIKLLFIISTVILFSKYYRNKINSKSDLEKNVFKKKSLVHIFQIQIEKRY